MRFFAIFIILLAMVLISKWLIALEDFGQFIKFLLFDVFIVNFWGTILLLAGLFTLIFTLYMIISKKAVNPKGTIMPAIVLMLITFSLGIGLSYNIFDDFADARSYLVGNVKEETVIISDFRYIKTTEGHLYYYTFSDGRTFEEGYRGKGFSQIEEGETYFIRYLPRTEKLLRIERKYININHKMDVLEDV
ncbi:hypothetical protein [Bacillus niameyensis]|uniref:hypothetical protein n=1 Tax=Bacillus niameyensis TaxID=1522308 RepID=UPI00078661F7|nr:hypothetical protein [Bacillus niameyensis]